MLSVHWEQTLSLQLVFRKYSPATWRELTEPRQNLSKLSENCPTEPRRAARGNANYSLSGFIRITNLISRRKFMDACCLRLCKWTSVNGQVTHVNILTRYDYVVDQCIEADRAIATTRKPITILRCWSPRSTLLFLSLAMSFVFQTDCLFDLRYSIKCRSTIWK